MKRTVNSEIIENWIGENGPQGLEKLAIKAGVSSSLLAKAKRGDVPKNLYKLRQIAEAIGQSVEEVFPLATTKKKAS